MPGPALIFAAPTAGVALGAKKRAENRRKQALSNKYSEKYPLSDDLNANSSSIAAAKNELINIRKRPANGQAAKRVKKREDELLSKWIGIMTAHGQDLKSGLAMSTSTEIVQVPGPRRGSGVLPPPVLPVIDQGAQVPESASQLGNEAIKAQEAADPGAPTTVPTEKKTNWLLIAGVAVGAVLLFNFMKKK